jgi:SLT domain-containing protein
MPAPNVQSAAFKMPVSAAGHAPDAKRVNSLPASTDAALGSAMNLEGVPQSWQPALRFIVAQESAGKVDARNPVHSARGLFQLTAANYHLNPNGARSFGNAVEEAQGGIRYIQQRYGTAVNAAAFWQQHHWY